MRNDPTYLQLIKDNGNKPLSSYTPGAQDLVERGLALLTITEADHTLRLHLTHKGEQLLGA